MQGPVLNDPEGPQIAGSSEGPSPSASAMSTCLVIRCPPSSDGPLPLLVQHSWLEAHAVSLSACSLKGQQTMLSSLIPRRQRKKHCYVPSISAADHKCLKFSDMFKPQSSGNSKQSSFREISSDLFRPFDLPGKFTSLELKSLFCHCENYYLVSKLRQGHPQRR